MSPTLAKGRCDWAGAPRPSRPRWAMADRPGSPSAATARCRPAPRSRRRRSPRPTPLPPRTFPPASRSAPRGSAAQRARRYGPETRRRRPRSRADGPWWPSTWSVDVPWPDGFQRDAGARDVAGDCGRCRAGRNGLVGLADGRRPSGPLERRRCKMGDPQGEGPAPRPGRLEQNRDRSRRPDGLVAQTARRGESR